MTEQREDKYLKDALNTARIDSEQQVHLMREIEKAHKEKQQRSVSQNSTVTQHTKIERECVQQFENICQQIKELKANYIALQQQRKESDNQVVQLKRDLQKEQEQQKELDNQVIQLQRDLQKEQEQRKESDSQVVQLQQDLQKEKESSAKLLSEIKAENRSLQSSQHESIAFGIEPWKVPRDKVELGSVIGGGGWGVVSKGKLHVAVKQFYPNILRKQNIARLKREMRMLALIRHPNLLQFIAAVFDENEDHEQNPPYIITELLDTSLRSAYEKALLPSHSLLSIFQDTARALDYLHRRHESIIHRDVSSANVLLKHKDEKWIAKLSDLGSANLAKEAYTMNEGARVYCAPEAFTFDTNAHSAGTLTPKIDVYSYGIVLCEVVTSTFPDKGEFPPMLTRVRREWPQLHQLILACTKQSPDQRPTMASVLASLEAFPPHY